MLDLSRELIGGVALALFWIHTLLIAGAAWLDWRDLGRLARGRVAAGIVRAGRGPGGAIARNVVAQIGRSKGDGVIHLNDAAHRSEVFGGVIELDGGGTVELEAGEAAAVWPDPEARARAAAVALPEATRERALVEARRARGWAREVEVALVPGQRVFVLDPTRDSAARVLAAVDPRAWARRKRGLIAGFVFAELALAGACTAAAVWPPLFDWVSMLGAAAALGFFLAVQPVGVSVSDAARTPDRAYLRGTL